MSELLELADVLSREDDAAVRRLARAYRALSASNRELQAIVALAVKADADRGPSCPVCGEYFNETYDGNTCSGHALHDALASHDAGAGKDNKT